MNATRTFNYLLNQVENSGLNYAVSKTPFSASISLKSSFVKNYKLSADEQVEICPNVNIKDEKSDVRHKTDNFDLKEEIRNLQEEVSKQKDVIEEKSKHIKVIRKDADDQIAQFRDELLKVKSDRSSLQAKLKSLEDENKLEKVAAIKKNETSKKLFSDQATNYESVIKTMKKEKHHLEMLVASANEKVAKEIDFLTFDCELCDYKSEAKSSLKDHIRSQHRKDVFSQVELKSETEAKEINFITYPCYYCRKLIKSKIDLEEHKPVCFKIKEFSAYPCEVCGAQCPDKNSLGRHKTKYHKLGTLSEDLEVELFWCDVCPLSYRSYAEFEYHRRGCH